MSSTQTHAHSVANTAEGSLVATVDLPIPPDRAFRALASPEIMQWWVRAGIFDTREWRGDVRVGGAWSASGMSRGQPYTLEGEFITVDAPRQLAHTWHVRGIPGAPTTVTYTLEPHDDGTRITLRHVGFTSAQACENTAMGWQTSLDRLLEIQTVHRGLPGCDQHQSVER